MSKSANNKSNGKTSESLSAAQDIGPILKAWPFDDQYNVRKVVDQGGQEKIQVRLDQGAFQGILQMELDGRPDGKQHEGRAFLFDHYKEKLLRHVAAHGSDAGFRVGAGECEEIFDESRRVYERYVFLLQIQDYDRVVRDTERNMEVFRFVNQFAARQKDRIHLEKWWPYVLRIHALAQVMLATKEGKFHAALDIIRAVRDRIEALPEVDAEEFHLERKRSLEAIEELEEEIREKRPLTKIERLKKEMADSVAKEQYERAAKLRDILSELES